MKTLGKLDRILGLFSGATIGIAFLFVLTIAINLLKSLWNNPAETLTLCGLVVIPIFSIVGFREGLKFIIGGSK